MTTRQARLIAAVVIAGGGLVCLVWAFVRSTGIYSGCTRSWLAGSY